MKETDLDAMLGQDDDATHHENITPSHHTDDAVRTVESRGSTSNRLAITLTDVENLPLDIYARVHVVIGWLRNHCCDASLCVQGSSGYAVI